MCADLAGGENEGLYLSEEALELTDAARPRDEPGLLSCSRCCLTASMPLESKGVRRLDEYGLPDSRISGGPCRAGGDFVRALIWSSAEVMEFVGACCTLATIAGFSKSYCWTVK